MVHKCYTTRREKAAHGAHGAQVLHAACCSNDSPLTSPPFPSGPVPSATPVSLPNALPCLPPQTYPAVPSPRPSSSPSPLPSPPPSGRGAGNSKLDAAGPTEEASAGGGAEVEEARREASGGRVGGLCLAEAREEDRTEAGLPAMSTRADSDT